MTMLTVTQVQQAFGEKEGNEIAGQCANIALLRSQSVKTSLWESQQIGDAEWLEYHSSHGPQGMSMNSKRVQRPLILPAEFMSLQSPVPDFVARSPESEYLQPWTVEDRVRLFGDLG
jgi:type IV secretory pathway TraG/TraD family ATPase VirD4